MRHTSTALLSLLTLPSLSLGYNVKPFKVNLSSRVSHLKELVKSTELPEASVLGQAGAGIELAWLKDRQKEWLEKYDWEKEQSAMNKFNHSTVDIGDMTVHFIHQRSSDPNAIPLLLTHGWPGSFYEFHEVIGPLSNPGSESSTSFHVVVPSLPGIGFTSPAPQGWSLNNTAALFNTLLTEVLGYESYVATGGDWGCVVTWGLHNRHADHVKAVLYTGLVPQVGPTYDALKSDPLFGDKVDSLSDLQLQRLRHNPVFTSEAFGYFIQQTNRPATIGLALYDNPPPRRSTTTRF
ncbi:Putative epoxide hydrolase OS=Stigmatella aurantiaca (strain DW4/3-1) GN=STAUR_4299 PE=3 SV=2 [Rhizoctonia solani AG-1 IB]|uniref:Putative epoxide hydrolase n=1 Tax=Thanatephorus cucumeris (strain AG1-IB / isolate 7/3/14) TaxID=1108050 RepID=A0A0B7FQE0_THACB|nr:Putative epoxide hydrolase OS=Stigmatella aurantiaca (strain DW4/3-1) GN=STAUR_4299 PE=3 SV=2 [Rhizoctonia solani AG-1 IB]